MKQAVKKAGYGVSSASAIEPYKQSAVDSTGAEKSADQAVGYRKLAVGELVKLINDPDVTLINVHIPYAGEIPGTELFIPFNRIKENKDKLPRAKKAKIILYCRSGYMSKIAFYTLTDLGYTNVYDVPGGMNAWRQAGKQLLSRKQ